MLEPDKDTAEATASALPGHEVRSMHGDGNEYNYPRGETIEWLNRRHEEHF